LRSHNGRMAQFTIRVPDEMHERLKAAAALETRSLNGEIVHLLDCALVQMEGVQEKIEQARRGFRIEHGLPEEGGR
jgi:plasmid stability protein